MRRALLRRSDFIAGISAGFSVAALTGGVAALARDRSIVELPPPVSDISDTIRVRLFGRNIVRVELGCDTPMSVMVPTGPISATSAVFDVNAAQSTLLDGKTVPTGAGLTLVSSPGPIVASATDLSGRNTQHRYDGSFQLAFEPAAITVINLVGLESYVGSILAAEVSPSWHPESLKAQAIVSRTYALSARQRSSKRAYDVTDGTSSQVYRGLDGLASPFQDAAKATQGQTLYAEDAIAETFYSSACGGHTADVRELTQRAGPAYLAGVSDADSSGRSFCVRAPYYQWKNEIPADGLARVAGLEADALADLVVVDRWADGRAKTVRVVRTDGTQTDVDGHHFYAQTAATLGYKVLPSAMFELRRSQNVFAVFGHGLGHGVGMCQWGARGRAEAGASAEAIATAYFPGTVVRASLSLRR